MKKQIFVALALAAAGCFGSDPNMNSQVFTGTAGTSGSMTVTGPIVGTPLATYDSNIAGFVLDPYHDTNQKNLADPAIIATQPGMMTPTMTFESGMGSPNPGSMRVVAPYTGPSQFVQIEAMSFGTSNTKNWTGGKLHMRAQDPRGKLHGRRPALHQDRQRLRLRRHLHQLPPGAGWKDFVLPVDAPMTLGTSGPYEPGQVIIVRRAAEHRHARGPTRTSVDIPDRQLLHRLPAGSSGTGGAGGGGGGTAGTSGGGAGGATGSGGAAGSGN